MDNFNYLDKFLTLCPSYSKFYIVKLEGSINKKISNKENDYLTAAMATIVNGNPNYSNNAMSENSVYMNKTKGPYIKKDGLKLYLSKFKRK